MKSIEEVSNTPTKPMSSIGINTVELSTKKFWLPLIFGVSLIYVGHPPYAAEQQGTSSQSTQFKGSKGESGKWGKGYRPESQGGTSGGKKPNVNMGNRPGGSPEGAGETSGSE